MEVPANSQNVQVDIRCMPTAGGELTGKVAADFTLWYRRGGAKTEITLVDLASLADNHTDGGLIEIGEGWYRLDVPDAAFVAGVRAVTIGGSVDGGVVLSAAVTIGPVSSTTTDSGEEASVATIRAQALRRIAEITASPKPSYNIDGQSVSWTEYLKQLQETINWCDSQTFAEDGPFEIVSQGLT